MMKRNALIICGGGDRGGMGMGGSGGGGGARGEEAEGVDLTTEITT